MLVFTQIFLWCVLLVSIAMRFMAPLEMNGIFLSAVGLLGLFSYIITCFYLRYNTIRFSWAGLFNFFCVSFLIVHFHNILIVEIYDDIRMNMKLWFSPMYACSSAALSLSGFTSFLIVYSLSKSKNRMPLREKATSTINPARLKLIVYILCVASGVLLLLFVGLAGNKFRSGAYAGGGDYLGGGASHIFILYNVFFFSMIVFDIYRMRVLYDHLSPIGFLRCANPFVLGSAGVYLLMSLYVGDRGPILQMLMLYAGAYSIFFGRIRFWMFAGCIVLGVMTMAFIGRYRTSDAGVSMEEKIEEGKYKMGESSWYHTTAELGGSFRCVAASEMVVEERGYFWGLFKLNNFVSAVPFASRFMAPYFGALTSGLTSGQFLTAVIIGPNSTIGVGTTIIADIYLDFGYVGVIIMMGILGWGFAFVEKRALTGYSLMHIALLLFMLSVAFYWPRSTFVPHVKLIVWGLAFIKIVHVFYGRNLKLSRNDILRRYRG
ncbi:MAG: O-antigen polysaccharide polymerase Wzy [Verrucomicrobiota bacterium]